MSLQSEAVLKQIEWDTKAIDYPVLGRILADSRDKPAWARARANAIGASDAASFSKIASAPLYLRSKLYSPFDGNFYTAHGNEREPAILRAFNFDQNFHLFRSAGNERHVATPDGIKLAPNGEVILAEAKTTTEPFRTIPRRYYRQVFWAQYVLGATRTCFCWEWHKDGVPVEAEPRMVWIDRDDNEIEKLITIADIVLHGMDQAAEFEKEMEAEK